MKIKKGFELREVCGESILVAFGRENMNFNKVISFNESAAYLWKSIEEKEFDAQTLATLLQEEYEVEAATAERDAAIMLEEWVKAGLVE